MEYCARIFICMYFNTDCNSEEVGHDHVHTKSGRVPYIEILYHLLVQAKKPWRQFRRTVLKYMYL